MTTQAQRVGGPTLTIRRAGQVCLAAGVLGAASGVALALVEPAVGSDQWSYPQSVGAFTATQVWFAIQHVGLVLGLLALWWSGAVGTSRLGRIGHYGAVGCMLAFAFTELAAITAATDSVDSTRVAVLNGLYGVFSILLGAALVAEGTAVLRAGVWRSWARWVPLAIGVWVFVPMLPALALSFTAARFAIAGWMLLFAALGWALTQPAAERWPLRRP